MNNKGVVITGCDTGNDNLKNLSIFNQKQKIQDWACARLNECSRKLSFVKFDTFLKEFTKVRHTILTRIEQCFIKIARFPEIY